MEPFTYEEESGLFWIEPWRRKFPELQAGITSRNLNSGQEYGNVAYHVGDDVDNVARNRDFLCAQLGISIQSMTCALQPHSNKIALITEDLRGAGATRLEDAIEGIDGLITHVGDTLLTLFFADCVPIYFYDPIKKVVGVAHASWKGTVEQIATKMVQKLQDKYGCYAENINVCIGPSIGPCCYQVDELISSAVRNIIPEHFSDVAKKDGNQHYKLNLQKINQILLQKEGVLPHNIESTHLCTSCNSNLFFSYRKEKGKTGRMAAFVMLKGEK